jgi:succinate-semialdehyde dehydrogenase/glutarate-semialdehyde dehydrogenase
MLESASIGQIVSSLSPSSQLRHARLLIGGAWRQGDSIFEVSDKTTGQLIGTCEAASHAQVDEAVASADRAFRESRLEPWDRFRILSRAAELIEAHRGEFVELIAAEAGFPVSDGENEVNRAVQTFLTSAEEAKRLSGEVVPLEGSPGNGHRMAFTIRVPRGVVCGITSFNSPLNMMAHKVAPALASGNTVVAKPPQATPYCSALLFQLLLEAGIPAGHANLINGPGSKIGGWLVANPDIAFYTFTGSTAVGKSIRDGIGLRPVALELGSIACTIVCEDADLARAAPRCANSAFRRAGQACTSTQRLYVHQDVLDAFRPVFIAAAAKLKVGDPRDPATAIGPMISEDEARRTESWIRDAVAGGAKVLHGGTRAGSIVEPTILEGAHAPMRVICDEVFGPVVSLIPFRSLDETIADINAMPFGIASGIFTRDVTRALLAARRLRVGTVHINESSTSRVDMMPFGGVKDSGMGREGPRYAMREMTEERLITFSLA